MKTLITGFIAAAVLIGWRAFCSAAFPILCERWLKKARKQVVCIISMPYTRGAMTSKDEEIQDIRAQEGRRGKRPIDIGELRRRRELERKMREFLENGDREAFIDAIVNDLGQLPGTSAYENSMKIWNRYRAARR